MELVKPPSKRGRKPKKNIKILEYNNEDSAIITHLPINIKDQINLNDKDKEIIKLRDEIKKLKENTIKNENDLVFNISEDNINNTKCWWCRYSFDTCIVSLPENYINNKFLTFGVFCSYNCALSYNIDINDENISKRSSLLNFMYKKTYNTIPNIIRAPDWRILQDYGGPISIEEFRNNFLFNNFEYNYIKPPIISRIYQIEKYQKIKKK